MLRNERYRGMLIWGRRGKTYRRGTKIRIARPAANIVRTEMPQLRIIDEETWTAVQAQIAKRSKFRPAGRAGPPAKSLLSGVARCAECGGPLEATSAKFGSVQVRLYCCAWHRSRGSSVCKMTLRRPVAGVDAAVVRWIEENVLSEEVVIEALREVRRRLAERASTVDVERPRFEAEARKLEKEIASLVAAIASGDPPAALVQAISDKEKRRNDLLARMEAMKAAPAAVDMEAKRLEQEARRRLSDFSALLERNPEEGRRALRALLDGPMRFAAVEVAEGRRFRFEGAVKLGAIVLPDALATTEGPASSGYVQKMTPRRFELRLRP
jgi:site-specific DNA recombinase